MKLLLVMCLLGTVVDYVHTHSLKHGPVYQHPPPQKYVIWSAAGYCSGKLSCGDGSHKSETCIDTAQVCDGVTDCPGGIDEQFCPADPHCDGMVCKDGKTCAKPCDKVMECPAGDDEDDCPWTCPDNEYKCSGEDRCVRLDQMCDGKRNCLFGDDEKHCAHLGPECYKSNRILCHDRRTCARPCNGVRECGPSGEDEADCPFICKEEQYLCVGEQKCISIQQVCDFRRDCRNGEDEAYCSDPCPPGWYRFRDSCYFFAGDDKLDYDDARAFCEEMGSQLVTINDVAENEFLKQVAMQRASDFFYIGLNDLDMETTFVWISTGEEATFFDWNPTEPTASRDNDDCVLLWRKYDFQWRVRRCNKKHRFICEQPTAVR